MGILEKAAKINRYKQRLIDCGFVWYEWSFGYKNVFEKAFNHHNVITYVDIIFDDNKLFCYEETEGDESMCWEEECDIPEDVDLIAWLDYLITEIVEKNLNFIPDVLWKPDSEIDALEEPLDSSGRRIVY